MSALAKSPRRGLTVLALLAAMLAVGALALASLGDMSDRGVGIIEFELARTTEKASEYYGQLLGGGSLGKHADQPRGRNEAPDDGNAGSNSLLLASLVPVASASHNGDRGNPRDFAVGGANNTFGFFQIGLSAHGGPDGSDPKGHVSARSRPQGGFPVPFHFGGEVTCLRVDGNRASIKYRFDHSDEPALEGGGIEVFVEDNGPPRGGQPADGSAFGAPLTKEAFEATDPAFCDDPNSAVYTPVDSATSLFTTHRGRRERGRA